MPLVRIESFFSFSFSLSHEAWSSSWLSYARWYLRTEGFYLHGGLGGGGGWHNKKELLLVWLLNNKEKTSSITTLLFTIVQYSSISLDCNSIMRMRTITHLSCLKVSSSSTNNFECLKPILPLGTNSSVKLTSSPLPSPMKIEGPKKVRKASIETRSNTFNFSYCCLYQRAEIQ